MEAEFFAVDGPLLGERFSLGSGAVHIGSAPSAHIKLMEVDAAPQHCAVRFEDGPLFISSTTAPPRGPTSTGCASRGTAWSLTIRSRA